ncbi:MAG: DNA polymerase IV [Planctomycetota bacterium]
MSTPERFIAHVDLDCFFAQVETLDDPAIRGKPVIVGGERREDGSVGRGVVTTSSYEARAFGVRTAMPLARAHRLCPHAVFRRGRFDRYRELSQRVFEVCESMCPDVRPVGIDEAYLDFCGLERWTLRQRTPLALPMHWSERLARLIQDRVREETGLTLSVGVGPNRFLAKIASGINKPAGICVVRAHEAEDFVSRLPIRALRGVGPAAERRLARLGVRTGADIVRRPRAEISTLLGEFGEHLYDHAHGVRGSELPPHDARRSISRDTTFREDVPIVPVGVASMRSTLAYLTAKAVDALRRGELTCGCVGVRVRDSTFRTLQREQSLTTIGVRRSSDEVEIADLAMALFEQLLDRHRQRGAGAVRLVGVKLSHLFECRDRQLLLGSEEVEGRRDRLGTAADAVRTRLGTAAILPARGLAHAETRRKRGRLNT